LVLGVERREEKKRKIWGARRRKRRRGWALFLDLHYFAAGRAKTGALTTSAPSRTHGNFILERRIKTPGRVAGQARLALPKGVQGAGRWAGGESGGDRPKWGNTNGEDGRGMETPDGIGDGNGGMGMGMGRGRIDRAERRAQGMEPSDGLARKGKGDRDGDGGRDKRRKWIQPQQQPGSGRKHVSLRPSSWHRTGCVIRTP
jgi:hypothetical protein